jgi:myo-inositol 2-dehydrogenase/D-chiro-inositol 1-dehydrogenase
VEVSWHAPRLPGHAPGLDDPHVMLLYTADGALSTLEVFLNAGYGYDIRCEIVGDGGTLALVEPARLVADAEGRRSSPYAADWRPRFADAYRLQLQAWVDAIAAGRPAPLPRARDGLAATVVAEAVIASMRDGGRPVPVEQPAA